MYAGIGALGMTIRIRDQTGIVCAGARVLSGYGMVAGDSRNGTFRNRKWPGTTRTPARKHEIRPYNPLSWRRPNRTRVKSEAMAGRKYHGRWTQLKG